MSGSKKFLLVLLSILLIISSLSITYGQLERSLTVLVQDPLGTPLEGLEVHLVKDGEVRKFVTNSTGFAEFRHLVPGEYHLQVKLDNLTVAEGVAKIPEERQANLTALLSTVKFQLSNLDGEPVGGLKLVMRNAAYTDTAESNQKGVVRIERIPYSSLKDVGSYSVEIKMKDLTVYKGSLEVDEPRISQNITLPLLNLKLTVVNLEGEPIPRLSIKLSSEGYSTEIKSGNGTAVFKNLPSSELNEVGPYRINVSMRTEGGDMPIFVEERTLESSQSISLIADLTKVSVKVVDREGEPVKGVKVLLSNQLLANFSSRETDENGVAVFENIPLSKNRVSAGVYSIKAIRAGQLVGETSREITEVNEVVELVVERGEVRLRFLDYRGSPLAGCHAVLIDELSGEKYNASTNNDGEALFRVFYGPYDLRVYKNNKLIYSSMVQLTEKVTEFRLEEVNFPLVIRVVDALGSPVNSAYIKLSAGNETLLEKELDGNPVTLNILYPLELRCDIYSKGGQLIHRELIYANKPLKQVVSLRDYICLNGLIRLELIASGIALALIALSLLFSLTLLRRARRKG